MKDLYQSLCFDVFFIKASSRAKNIKRINGRKIKKTNDRGNNKNHKKSEHDAWLPLCVEDRISGVNIIGPYLSNVGPTS